ncbi:serine hydrolase [Streptosporangium minutum]|uniref:Serine hydrolase n=1 Tax=Streptosporangium minutum TaxID=569862 RepID=A0A243RWX0_9ACTN|nr:serine hydrolase [Streptosporangium minutum]OUC99519.1 serine hydrolase [Streptosporangium minutum]
MTPSTVSLSAPGVTATDAPSLSAPGAVTPGAVPSGGLRPPAPRPPAPPRVSAPRVSTPRLTRALDRFLTRYGGRTAVTVRDLATARTYHYHRDLQLPTASASKINILMALLLTSPWRRLTRRTRDDAERMIRFSDNAAADRLYERIGLEAGLARADREFGLRHTYAPAGRCVDLYCWGITRTTASDQVRLIGALARKRSPLPERDRERVLRLMANVTSEQRWGISAAACEGGRLSPESQVSLKNGWLRHVADGRWAVVSVGLIREPGHDYAVAVLTEDSPSMGTGVARVEGVVKRILAAFRGRQGCATAGGQAVLSTSR